MVPLNLLEPGMLFGTFEVMSKLNQVQISSPWNVTAGVRTIITLQKLGNKEKLEALYNHYEINMSHTNVKFQDQFELFKEIALKSSGSSWNCKLLFLTSKWLEKIFTSENWKGLYFFLSKQAWKQAQFAINKMTLTNLWSKSAEALTRRNLKLRPYIADTMKHLLALKLKMVPGFGFSHEESLAPVKSIRYALETIYKTNFPPLIMHIQPIDTVKPIYYSLSCPTLLEGDPNDCASSSLLSDQKKILRALELSNREHLESMRFYHHDDIPGYNISSSKQLVSHDQYFSTILDNDRTKKWASNSIFFRGAVQFV